MTWEICSESEDRENLCEITKHVANVVARYHAIKQEHRDFIMKLLHENKCEEAAYRLLALLMAYIVLSKERKA